ncbi:C40 family peptidase [Nocardioides insulae]|uniref:C40 family peptidase n=1 Tax=Nocardioides insulae TaxID=394734 RepID=UPI000403EAB7|nr:C40 family peptidase [Nocardioides insulae]
MPYLSLRTGGLSLLVRLLFVAALGLGTLAALPATTAHASETTRTVSGSTALQSERKIGARERRTRKVRKALRIVKNQKGDPYRYGASGPGSFDCSGLVNYAYRKAGFKGTPRTSSQQAGWAKRIKRKHLRPGDLVFFTGSGGVYHVGIFSGRARGGAPKMINAPYSGTRVRTEKIWGNNWFAGTVRR